MRKKAIHRVFDYFEQKSLKHTAVEKKLGIANGYFKKTLDRDGSLGSDILEKIVYEYRDLNPFWLLTGEGTMIVKEQSLSAKPGQISSGRIIDLMEEHIKTLNNEVATKDKLIKVLEEQKLELSKKISTDSENLDSILPVQPAKKQQQGQLKRERGPQ